MDALLIQSAHSTLRGNRLGIFGSGGGVSVTSSDAASRAGMRIPALSPSTCDALSRFGVPGTSVANPIDIPVWGLRDGNRLILADIINLLKVDDNLDSLIVYVEMGSIMDFADDEADGRRQLEEICASVAQASTAGPKVSLALRSTGDQTQDDFVREQRAKLLEQGIAVFSSTARAVRAHAKLYELSSKQGRG
jgi:acyl-CoA synthetase (NDP forming)